MSKDWQEQISLEDMWEQAEELLINDFQYYLADALAPAVGYDVRNSILKDLVDDLASGKQSKEDFAALGELLYQWAAEEAMNAVEYNNSPHPRLG